MNIAICEDNEKEAVQLKLMLENYMPHSLLISDIDIYSNATSFLESEKIYDLVVFDCKLPDIDGVEAAKIFRKKNSVAAIIFITAFLEYATGGYEVDALRFLLKPVNPKKLAEALVALENKFKNECMLEITGQHEPYYAKSTDIMYIEVVERRTIVRFEDFSVESHKSLATFEQEIRSDAFFKTRRQFIVNMKFIQRKNGNEIYMQNGEKVIISRRRLADFNEKYANFLKFNR
ncbi:MAG: response regulator transcription factor [Clostridia bacterium]|nr:response regulator transcription factor [Clostridia bacterium]